VGLHGENHTDSQGVQIWLYVNFLHLVLLWSYGRRVLGVTCL